MSTDTQGNDEVIRENLLLLRRNSIQGSFIFQRKLYIIFHVELFAGYYYEVASIKSSTTEKNTSMIGLSKSIATNSTASTLFI